MKDNLNTPEPKTQNEWDRRNQDSRRISNGCQRNVKTRMVRGQIRRQNLSFCHPFAIPSFCYSFTTPSFCHSFWVFNSDECDSRFKSLSKLFTCLSLSMLQLRPNWFEGVVKGHGHTKHSPGQQQNIS